MQPSVNGQGFFGIKVSKPGVNVNQANTQDLIYQSDYSSTIYYDSTNSRIIEGKLPDGTYGMWVSKPGLNANDPNAAINGNLVFNSGQDIFRIIAKVTGSFSFTTVSGVTNTSVGLTHNLGYQPLALVYGTNIIMNPFSPTASTSLLPIMNFGAGASSMITNYAIWVLSVTTTQIVCGINIYAGSGNACSGNLTAYIIQETAS